MIAPFDFFQIDASGQPLWRGFASDIETAKASIARLGTGTYFVISLKTRHRVEIVVDATGNAVTLTTA
jgi:hypothetical protein